jgi:hypothetical protein
MPRSLDNTEPRQATRLPVGLSRSSRGNGYKATAGWLSANTRRPDLAT